MDLHLTPEMRWILTNQYRILTNLASEDYEKKHYDRAIDALESGYEAEYQSFVPWLSGTPMSVDECRGVVDILEMHRELRWSYDDLADNSGIEEHDIQFRGFDGNNESRTLGYARYLINEHHWAELAGSADDLNSHMPVLDMYQRMLSVWKACRDRRGQDQSFGPGDNLLSKEDIHSIIEARTHPANR